MTNKPRNRPIQRAKTAQTAPASVEPREDASEATSSSETAELGTAPAEPAGTVAAPVVVRAGDGRPKCNVPGCILPEFVEGVGVCGAHYATQRGYANKPRS